MENSQAMKKKMGLPQESGLKNSRRYLYGIPRFPSLGYR